MSIKCFFIIPYEGPGYYKTMIASLKKDGFEKNDYDDFYKKIKGVVDTGLEEFKESDPFFYSFNFDVSKGKIASSDYDINTVLGMRVGEKFDPQSGNDIVKYIVFARKKHWDRKSMYSAFRKKSDAKEEHCHFVEIEEAIRKQKYISKNLNKFLGLCDVMSLKSEDLALNLFGRIAMKIYGLKHDSSDELFDEVISPRGSQEMNKKLKEMKKTFQEFDINDDECFKKLGKVGGLEVVLKEEEENEEEESKDDESFYASVEYEIDNYKRFKGKGEGSNGGFVEYTFLRKVFYANTFPPTVEDETLEKLMIMISGGTNVAENISDSSLPENLKGIMQKKPDFFIHCKKHNCLIAVAEYKNDVTQKNSRNDFFEMLFIAHLGYKKILGRMKEVKPNFGIPFLFCDTKNEKCHLYSYGYGDTDRTVNKHPNQPNRVYLKNLTLKVHGVFSFFEESDVNALNKKLGKLYRIVLDILGRLGGERINNITSPERKQTYEEEDSEDVKSFQIGEEVRYKNPTSNSENPFMKKKIGKRLENTTSLYSCENDLVLKILSFSERAFYQEHFKNLKENMNNGFGYLMGIGIDYEKKIDFLVMKKLYPLNIVKDSNELFSFVRDISKQILFIHKSKILHLDIKPENIMKTENDNFTLIDFGISVFEGGKFELTSLETGEFKGVTTVGHTKRYAPNEQLEKSDGEFKVSYATDYFSFGMTVKRMFFPKVEEDDIIDDNVLFKVISNMIDDSSVFGEDIKNRHEKRGEKGFNELLKLVANEHDFISCADAILRIEKNKTGGLFGSGRDDRFIMISSDPKNPFFERIQKSGRYCGVKFRTRIYFPNFYGDDSQKEGGLIKIFSDEMDKYVLVDIEILMEFCDSAFFKNLMKFNGKDKWSVVNSRRLEIRDLSFNSLVKFVYLLFSCKIGDDFFSLHNDLMCFSIKELLELFYFTDMYGEVKINNIILEILRNQILLTINNNNFNNNNNSLDLEEDYKCFLFWLLERGYFFSEVLGRFDEKNENNIGVFFDSFVRKMFNLDTKVPDNMMKEMMFHIDFGNDVHKKCFEEDDDGKIFLGGCKRKREKDEDDSDYFEPMIKKVRIEE